jgi:hypothetical protein
MWRTCRNAGMYNALTTGRVRTTPSPSGLRSVPTRIRSNSGSLLGPRIINFGFRIRNLIFFRTKKFMKTVL